jgi:phosphoglycolate phosphatase
MNQYKLPLVDYDTLTKHVGDGLTAFIKSLAGKKAEDPNILKEMFEAFSVHYEDVMLNTTNFYPSALNFMNKFKSNGKNKIGVVTNKPEKHARIILKHLGIAHDYFVQIFGGDTFEVKKPHPKPLLEMMNLASAQPQDTIMIGDSRQDLEAARSANTHFIAVGFGYNSVERLTGLGAKTFMHHFDELENLTSQFFV